MRFANNSNFTNISELGVTIKTLKRLFFIVYMHDCLTIVWLDSIRIHVWLMPYHQYSYVMYIRHELSISIFFSICRSFYLIWTQRKRMSLLRRFLIECQRLLYILLHSMYKISDITSHANIKTLPATLLLLLSFSIMSFFFSFIFIFSL